MCIDYTDLNKACPKDFYPLSNINQLIDTTYGYSLLSFLHLLGIQSNFHVQRGYPKDDLHHSSGDLCLQEDDIRLINTGATYQRIMNHVFRK